MTKLLVWHFGRDDGTLGYGDGRKIERGVKLVVPDPTRAIIPCEYGMHGVRKWSCL